MLFLRFYYQDIASVFPHARVWQNSRLLLNMWKKYYRFTKKFPIFFFSILFGFFNTADPIISIPHGVDENKIILFTHKGSCPQHFTTLWGRSRRGWENEKKKWEKKLWRQNDVTCVVFQCIYRKWNNVLRPKKMRVIGREWMPCPLWSLFFYRY